MGIDLIENPGRVSGMLLPHFPAAQPRHPVLREFKTGLQGLLAAFYVPLGGNPFFYLLQQIVVPGFQPHMQSVKTGFANCRQFLPNKCSRRGLLRAVESITPTVSR